MTLLGAGVVREATLDMVDWETTTEISAEGSEPANRPVETRRPLPELDEAVEDRLADIGYLE